jgi:exopolyphosphatase/guanosine-5'-triphosphate,3'-diphosphate pyrophosphatase
VRIAALDLGSNSFHLLVVEARPDGSFLPLAREKEMLRLGDVVARDGALTEEAIEAAIETVRRFKTIADVQHADEIVAMATAAMRQAANGPEAAERIEAATGVRVQVVSGIREAQLVFEAVRASVLIDPGPALCADLGGGSLELSVGDRFGLSCATSLHLGVGRLTTEFVRTDPPSKKDRARLKEHISRSLDTVLDDLLACGPKLLVGTSGTFCALARSAAARRDGIVPYSVNQLTVTARELAALGDLVNSLSSYERGRLAGIDARRAELMPAGAAVAEVLMDKTGLRELTVSEWGLREGIIISTIARHDRVEFSNDPRAIRLASVMSLCLRSRWPEAHSRQVAQLALELFDSTVALHGLDAEDRELLELGALLHDIGEHVSRDGHARHSAYLIENGDLRGFSPDEIHMLSCLGRYHVRGRPRESFQAWESLDRKDRDRVLKMLAMLRIADGLDASHDSVIGHLGVELDGPVVEVVVSARGDAELERWMLQRKKLLFQELFELPVSLEVVPTGPEEMQGLGSEEAGLA